MTRSRCPPAISISSRQSANGFGQFIGPVAATAPGAPTIGTATAGNAQATINFIPPVSNGGSPITTYTATANPGGLTATGTASPLTVTGLTNGTSYTFTVTATNAIGASLPSFPSNSITPGIQTATIVPASILYGNVPLTVPITQTVTFTNTSGTGAFYLITALSTADARFVAAGSGASPCNVGVNVLAGASCTYNLTFTPTGTGAYNNTTTVTFQPLGMGPTFTQAQASNGTGFIPPSSMAPSSLNFGNVPLTLAQTQSFTFTNNSNTTLFPATYTLTNIATTGLGYTAVGSGGNPCAVGLMLAAGANCGMTVTFQIGGVGASGGTTTITFLAGLGANPPYTQSIGSSGTGFSMPATATPRRFRSGM